MLRAVLLASVVCVSFGVILSDHAKIMKLFNGLDVNGNKHISQEELKNYVQGFSETPGGIVQHARFIKIWDERFGDGDFGSEFLMAFFDPDRNYLINDADYPAVFNRTNTNGDEWISFDELESAVGKIYKNYHG